MVTVFFIIKFLELINIFEITLISGATLQSRYDHQRIGGLQTGYADHIYNSNENVNL